MDRSAGLGAADRRAAGSLDPPRSHSGDERGKLPAEEQQEKERVEPTIAVRNCRERAASRGTCVRAEPAGGCFWRRLPRRPKRVALRASQGDAPAAPKSRKQRPRERKNRVRATPE